MDINNNDDIITTTPTVDENRVNGFHVIKIKSENSKNVWSLYEPDFKELHSFFGKFSYMIISLASLLNSGIAMLDDSYKYLLVTITYFITFISIINTTFSFEKKAEDLYFISKEYENISYKIKHLLYNSENTEKDPEQWYDIINNEIDVLDTLYFTNINRVKKSIKDDNKIRYTEHQSLKTNL